MPKVSKGCGTCRAARVRCDLNQPRCDRCTRMNKECQYRRPGDLVFRNVTYSTIKRNQWQITQQASKNATGDKYGGSFVSFQNKGHFGSEQQFVNVYSMVLPPTINPGPMMRYQASSSYCRDYFPRISCANEIDLSQFVFSSIFELSHRSPMLETACSALAYIFQGKIGGDEHTLQYGVRLYNQAIRQMTHAIGHKFDIPDMEDIVYTCVIFQQVQIHYSPSSMGEWLAHIDGLSAIMRHYTSTIGRIPSTPLLRTIFSEHQKLQVVLSGFMFLPDEVIAWIKEPNEGGSTPDYLWIMAELSHIGKATNTIDKSESQACNTLLAECLALEQRITNFLTTLTPGGEPPTYARGEVTSGIEATDDLFGPAYHFSSFDDAFLHNLLWLCLSFIPPLILKCRILSGIIPPPNHPAEGFENEAHRQSRLYVDKAIRTLPYCGRQGMNSSGMVYAVWAVTQASRVYTHCKDWERFLWAQNALVYMEGLGFGIAARFREQWWNYWFETHKHDGYRVLNWREKMGTRSSSQGSESPYQDV